MELKVLCIVGLIDFVVQYDTLKNCLWRSPSPPFTLYDVALRSNPD